MAEKPALPERNTEEYLGDGAYVSFDGWNLWLRAPRAGGDHLVALDPAAYRTLRNWVRRFPELASHMGEVF